MGVETGEREAHEQLRDAIRTASLAHWDRVIGSDRDDEGYLAETRPEVERGVLVDYVVVAVFDSGSDNHVVTSVLRTDGSCSPHRVLGLLHLGLDTVESA